MRFHFIIGLSAALLLASCTRNGVEEVTRVLWAEEGLTGSDISYTSTADGATSQFSTRCVRDIKG